jgi:N-acetylglucosamine-6-phosphate deacetylase
MNAPDQHVIAADFVFDGEKLLRDAAVLINDSKITRLAPRTELSQWNNVLELPPGAWIAPGFIDCQVNGGGDVLFNDNPTPEGISRIVNAHRKFGATALLPTLITDVDDVMFAALDAVQIMLRREPGVLGLHFEGPFLSPAKPGVHRRELFRRPNAGDLRLLTSLRDGVTLVTLAPEEAPVGFIAELTRSGIRVSLGHSMASYEQTRAAMNEGLTGFTHLFNAMPPLLSREPGPVAAALESPDAFYGLIVDGEHVAPPVLRLAMRGLGHPILVTDAMPPVGGAKRTFALHGEEIEVREGRCCTKDGTLAGSAIDMATAVRNCVRLLGLPLEQALRFASTEPAKFLGLSHLLGRLAPGYRADIVAFDPADVSILGTWVAGKPGEWP